eukprot:jgi/Mesvir1/15267/Mv06487-RA.1
MAIWRAHQLCPVLYEILSPSPIYLNNPRRERHLGRLGRRRRQNISAILDHETPQVTVVHRDEGVWSTSKEAGFKLSSAPSISKWLPLPDNLLLGSVVRLIATQEVPLLPVVRFAEKTVPTPVALSLVVGLMAALSVVMTKALGLRKLASSGHGKQGANGSASSDAVRRNRSSLRLERMLEEESQRLAASRTQWGPTQASDETEAADDDEWDGSDSLRMPSRGSYGEDDEEDGIEWDEELVTLRGLTPRGGDIISRHMGGWVGERGAVTDGGHWQERSWPVSSSSSSSLSPSLSSVSSSSWQGQLAGNGGKDGGKERGVAQRGEEWEDRWQGGQQRSWQRSQWRRRDETEEERERRWARLADVAAGRDGLKQAVAFIQRSSPTVPPPTDQGTSDRGSSLSVDGGSEAVGRGGQGGVGSTSQWGAAGGRVSTGRDEGQQAPLAKVRTIKQAALDASRDDGGEDGRDGHVGGRSGTSVEAGVCGLLDSAVGGLSPVVKGAMSDDSSRNGEEPLLGQGAATQGPARGSADGEVPSGVISRVLEERSRGTVGGVLHVNHIDRGSAGAELGEEGRILAGGGKRSAQEAGGIVDAGIADSAGAIVDASSPVDAGGMNAGGMIDAGVVDAGDVMDMKDLSKTGSRTGSDMIHTSRSRSDKSDHRSDGGGGRGGDSSSDVDSRAEEGKVSAGVPAPSGDHQGGISASNLLPSSVAETVVTAGVGLSAAAVAAAQAGATMSLLDLSAAAFLPAAEALVAGTAVVYATHKLLSGKGHARDSMSSEHEGKKAVAGGVGSEVMDPKEKTSY